MRVCVRVCVCVCVCDGRFSGMFSDKSLPGHVHSKTWDQCVCVCVCVCVCARARVCMCVSLGGFMVEMTVDFATGRVER